MNAISTYGADDDDDDEYDEIDQRDQAVDLRKPWSRPCLYR